MELDLRRGGDLQREEEEDFFFCFPPPPPQSGILGWAGGLRPGKTLLSFFSILISFLFLLISVFDFYSILLICFAGI
jgi:hypothetical protein